MKRLFLSFFCSLLFLAEPARPAGQANLKIMMEQVTAVIQHVHIESNVTASINEDQEHGYFSICLNEESGYGILLGNSRLQCVTYNREYEQLEVPGNYQVINVQEGFNQVANAFLNYRPDVSQFSSKNVTRCNL